jgi:hypothetical protein
MELDTLSDAATVASAIVAAVATIVAAWALTYARRQLRENSRIAHETTALTAYREYLRLCFDQPELSSARLAENFVGVAGWDGVLTKLTPESERYLWMLTILLNTCELVLIAEPEDATWRAALADQVRYHDASLSAVWPEWRGHYDGRLQRLVEEVLTPAQSAGARAPSGVEGGAHGRLLEDEVGVARDGGPRRD